MDDTTYLIYSLFMFITGTLFGSFFSLATYRIPRKQDIVYTRSYCPVCKHKLGFFDCFPILSYISTVGRCKYCKCFISPRYILLELASGFVFLFSYIFFGFSLMLFIFLACYTFLVIYIGSEIMRKKMTPSEVKEVEEIKKRKEKDKLEKKSEKESKKIKKSKKAGSINIEIIVAVILFVFFFIAIIGVTRNYKNTYSEYKIKSDALNVCLNQINVAAATNFNDLESTTGTESIDGVDYSYVRNVSFLNEEASMKNISVIVTYNTGSENETIELKKVVGGI